MNSLLSRRRRQLGGPGVKTRSKERLNNNSINRQPATSRKQQSTSALFLCIILICVLVYSVGVIILIKKNPINSNENKHSGINMDRTALGRHQAPSLGVKDTLAVLTAYMEPINTEALKQKPLLSRNWTSSDLTAHPFPELNSCSKLMQQWPVDDYPEADPFLPWIHDVFPTHDGEFVQFVAQNKRRCKTGTTKRDIEALRHTEPQISLFQHVPIKKLQDGRYRLSSHEDADPNSIATRFLCRFKSSVDKSYDETTFSVYNFDYEWAGMRKHQKVMFHDHGRDIKQVHTSQLLFKCPVPPSLQETIRKGSSIIDDYATIFVDLVPIRTPPRYGHPGEFLQPYYSKSTKENKDAFEPDREWGSNHILPTIENSGRWSNIPVCKPSLMTYYGDEEPPTGRAITEKKHRLVSCLWASAGYSTRGERFAINDGYRRLFEWISYKRMIGVEHFYLYDNSASGNPNASLQSIKEKFPPGVITIMNWPSTVCNNKPNNVDSPGERSSQYAAEASCRLRFGPHTEWILQMDIDEYFVPMGNLTTIPSLLDKLDDEGKKIVSFGSYRAWPRRRFIETPQAMYGVKQCGKNERCFQLRIPMNYTMLQAYNCDRQKPGEKVKQMPAEKQIYRPSYVLHHFIHYSTVTVTSNMNQDDVKKAGRKWNAWTAFPDQLSRFGDERNEGLMLHTKAVAHQDTIGWEETCKASYTGKGACRIGTPFPDDMSGVNEMEGDEGWKFNCYVNNKIDNYFVPRLEEELKTDIPEIAARLWE